MKLSAKLLNLAGALLAFAAVFPLAGCHAIYDESDCTESYNLIKLEYDHNMKFADAFPSEVKRVHLLAFDSKTGILVKAVDQSRDQLRDGNKVELAVEPGEYDLLVWGGDYRTHFDIAEPVVGKSTIEEFHARLKRQELADGHHSGEDLEALFHGLKHVDLPYASPSKPNVETVKLKKNTNVIRVVLQHVSGEPIDHSTFNFTIRDNNGWLNHDNSLRDSREIQYHPWLLKSGMIDINTDPKDAPGTRCPDFFKSTRSILGGSLAEFTLNRLLMENNPRLTVTDRSGKTVLDISVRDYALLVKGFYNEKMDDQEYLDRQDEYNMTFFLDEGNRWINAVIIINNWRIVYNKTPLE